MAAKTSPKQQRPTTLVHRSYEFLFCWAELEPAGTKHSFRIFLLYTKFNCESPVLCVLFIFLYLGTLLRPLEVFILLGQIQFDAYFVELHNIMNESSSAPIEIWFWFISYMTRSNESTLKFKRKHNQIWVSQRQIYG